MAAEAYSTMTTKHPNVMEAITALTNAVSQLVKRDKTITSMLLALPEHQEVCKERDSLKKQLSDLKARDELVPPPYDQEPLKITIHEKSEATQTMTASDIRKHYDVQDKNVVKDVKTVTAQLGSLSISTACKETCPPGGFANRLNDFSQKLYEVIDSLGQDNEAYGDMQSIAEEFETSFKPWLSTSISKQSIIDLMPLPRTTINDEEEKIGDDVSEEEESEVEEDDGSEDQDDDEEESEVEEDDGSEDQDDEEEESEVEEDDGSEDQDDDEEEEETSVDNVDAVANKWDEKEHNRVVQGDKDEEEPDDLSEEEEDDGTTVSDDEEPEEGGSEEEEEEEEEVADPETSSEELVVCEMEDEDGNALEYLTNDPEEMNGDIFELLDGDEVGKKIGRFVDGEPEFFD